MQKESFLPILELAIKRGKLSTKQGVAYSPLFGIKPTLLVEVYRKNSWSADIGLARDNLLGGVSRDVYKDNLSINIGGVINKKKKTSFYTGVSWRF